jgi:hypothetical protein
MSPLHRISRASAWRNDYTINRVVITNAIELQIGSAGDGASEMRARRAEQEWGGIGGESLTVWKECRRSLRDAVEGGGCLALDEEDDDEGGVGCIAAATFGRGRLLSPAFSCCACGGGGCGSSASAFFRLATRPSSLFQTTTPEFSYVL